MVVPGAPLQALNREIKNHALIEWISKQAKTTDFVTSVCVGSFLLAKARLLDMKRGTTPRAAYDYFAQLFPRVPLIRDKKVVADGKVITADGLTAGIQMALYVVKLLLNKEAALRTTQALMLHHSFDAETL